MVDMTHHSTYPTTPTAPSCACTSKRDPGCALHHVHRMDTGAVLSSHNTEHAAIDATHVTYRTPYALGTSHPAMLTVGSIVGAAR